MERETWVSRDGFILAAIGSAVGLGNIWRFPWLTADNGGSAFLVAYLVAIFVVGIPGLMVSFVIGRRSKRNPVGAFRTLAGGTHWNILGGLCLVTSLVLLSFYTVVGGWVVRYVLESITGGYFHDPASHFSAIAFGMPAFFFQLVFLFITGAIVTVGVQRGIESTTRLLTPAIVVFLGGLAIWTWIRAPASPGYDFYLGFDGTYFTQNYLSVIGAASGQALFSLSIGSGTMITYASYLGEDRSLLADGSIIAIVNLGIGLLAGLVVFPLLFTVVGEPTGGGPGALFVSLAGAFGTLPGGRIIGVAFYLTVFFAALSSAISILEMPVAYFVDEHGLSRPTATAVLTALLVVTGGVNAFNESLFDFVAGPLVSQLLTLGLLGFMLYAAWVLGDESTAEFKAGAGPLSDLVATPWRLIVGTLLPLFLLLSILSTLASMV
ncbi:sodium-dependent transporter [Halocatena halophila]|uniref:sodium-dependent transporter n=1 Tax=Halocatena halophila TaxID=2814576 RepID=UPI002ED388F3